MESSIFLDITKYWVINFIFLGSLIPYILYLFSKWHYMTNSAYTDEMLQYIIYTISSLSTLLGKKNLKGFQSRKGIREKRVKYII